MTTTIHAPETRSDDTDERSLARVDDTIARIVEGDGILTSICTDALRVPGKKLRARLAVAAGRALDADAGDAIAWGAAVELVHQASLIHDDLQDGDRVRRGVPTTWVRHGAAQAINAGDLLLILPSRALARCRAPDDVKWRLSEALNRAVEQMVRGQADEPGLRGQPTPDAWRLCARKKTGALFGVPVEGAALLAGRGAREAEALARPFVKLGELFQMADDIIDAFGDKGRGRVGCDLDEGKVSSLVTAHLARHPGAAAWLLSILDAPRGETRTTDIEEAIARFDEGGALDDVLTAAAMLADDIAAAPVLAVEPALARVAAELLERVMRPLEAIALERFARATEREQ